MGDLDENIKTIVTSIKGTVLSKPMGFQKLAHDLQVELSAMQTKLADLEPFFDVWMFMDPYKVDVTYITEFEELFRQDLEQTFNAQRVTFDHGNKIINLDMMGEVFYLYWEPNKGLKIAVK